MAEKIPFYLEPETKNLLEHYARSIWLDASELLRLLARREMKLGALQRNEPRDEQSQRGRFSSKMTVHFHSDEHTFEFLEYLGRLNISRSKAMRELVEEELKTKRLKRFLLHD